MTAAVIDGTATAAELRARVSVRSADSRTNTASSPVSRWYW